MSPNNKTILIFNKFYILKTIHKSPNKEVTVYLHLAFLFFLIALTILLQAIGAMIMMPAAIARDI